MRNVLAQGDRLPRHLRHMMLDHVPNGDDADERIVRDDWQMTEPPCRHDRHHLVDRIRLLAGGDLPGHALRHWPLEAIRPLCRQAADNIPLRYDASYRPLL